MASACPSCAGTGFIIREDDRGVAVSQRCSCERDGREARLERAAGIPERYAHCEWQPWERGGSFEVHHPSHQAAWELARAWAEGFPAVDQDLMLVGPPGRGKTHLVVACARYLMANKGIRVLFHEQRALLKALQGTFDSNTGLQESDVLRPVLDCELLILDDLGAGRTTEWAKDVLHDIIAHRYNERKHLVVTTNLALGDDTTRRGKRAVDQPSTLRDRLGDPLISRLREMCRIVDVSGDDYRTEILAKRGF